MFLLLHLSFSINLKTRLAKDSRMVPGTLCRTLQYREASCEQANLHRFIVEAESKEWVKRIFQFQIFQFNFEVQILLYIYYN